METKIKSIINDVKIVWIERQNNLIKIYKINKSGGEARKLSGQLTEVVLETIINGINKEFDIKINSLIGSKDYLEVTLIYGERKIICKNIQVDRHLFHNNKRLGFIENKTYLDACYYDRALADFKKIIFALKQKNNNNIEDLKFIVFSGQNAISDDKQEFLELFFQYEMYKMGVKIIETKIFYYLNEKKRNSSTPIYIDKFSIDENTIKEFILYLISPFL